ncbi:hypothetical protein BpHYR1_041999 [Brachionus plicatilis]|uniref:Uncharacterized protein n=1 Tax=Brachionus plicatilis TaxID=10195 RepID=A0A3M7S4I6_BRAPC|nr:hypothetical protein BpHYR1_041999 [Brachionus plicatilis]
MEEDYDKKKEINEHLTAYHVAASLLQIVKRAYLGLDRVLNVYLLGLQRLGRQDRIAHIHTVQSELNLL